MTIQEVVTLEVDSVVKIATKLTPGKTKRELALVKVVDNLADPTVTVQLRNGKRLFARPSQVEFVKASSFAQIRRTQMQMGADKIKGVDAPQLAIFAR